MPPRGKVLRSRHHGHVGDSVSPVALSPTFADAEVKKYFVSGFWRVGRVMIVDFFSSVKMPAAWTDKMLVTGLPSPAGGVDVWAPCVVQSSSDSARYMAHVDPSGTLFVSNKSVGSGGGWVAFSLTYVSK